MGEKRWQKLLQTPRRTRCAGEIPSQIHSLHPYMQTACSFPVFIALQTLLCHSVPEVVCLSRFM